MSADHRVKMWRSVIVVNIWMFTPSTTAIVGTESLRR